jgi:hypothetical protein
MSQPSARPTPDKLSLIRELAQLMRGGRKLEAAAYEDAVRSWQERFRLKTYGAPVEWDVSNYLPIRLGGGGRSCRHVPGLTLIDGPMQVKFLRLSDWQKKISDFIVILECAARCLPPTPLECLGPRPT